MKTSGIHPSPDKIIKSGYSGDGQKTHAGQKFTLPGEQDRTSPGFAIILSFWDYFDIHKLSVVGNSALTGVDKSGGYKTREWIKK